MKKQSGFSLIELLIVVAIIGIIAAIAIPNLLKSRQAANEASAISSLRTVGTGQAKWQAVNGKGKDFAPSLIELGEDFLTDLPLVFGSKSGFTFTSVGVLSADSATHASYFDTTGSPWSGGPFGSATRSFYSNETYVIYQQPGNVSGVWGTTPTDRIPDAPAGPLQ